MNNKLSVRWCSACIIGFILGMLTSIIPLLLWRKIALNQGNEFLVDILIIMSIVIGSWLFVRHSKGINSALLELIIVIVFSSIIAAIAVIVMDAYNYEPITLSILLKAIPASLIFGLPSYLLVFIYIKFFKRGWK